MRGKIAGARALDLERETKEKEELRKAQDKPDLVDSIPAVEHRKKMTISSGRWFTGEYRHCEIAVSENPTTLGCSDLPISAESTRMDVVFYGSMENAKWDCKRRVDDIYCEPQK